MVLYETILRIVDRALDYELEETEYETDEDYEEALNSRYIKGLMSIQEEFIKPEFKYPVGTYQVVLNDKISSNKDILSLVNIQSSDKQKFNIKCVAQNDMAFSCVIIMILIKFSLMSI